MTLNFSGGREGPTWSLDPSSVTETSAHHYLGDLARDPAVANLFKNSFSSTLSPSFEASREKTERRHHRSGDHLKLSYDGERERAILFGGGNPFAKVVDRPIEEGTVENFSERLLRSSEEDPFAVLRNGWSTR